MSEAMQWLEPRDRAFRLAECRRLGTAGRGLAAGARDQGLARPVAEENRAPCHVVSGHGGAFSHRLEKLVFRVTFVDAPDTPPATPAVGWERSRPYSSRSTATRKYVASMAGAHHFRTSRK